MEKIKALYEIISYNQEEIASLERHSKPDKDATNMERVIQMVNNSIGSIDKRLSMRRSTTQLLAEQLYKELKAFDKYLQVIESDLDEPFECGEVKSKSAIIGLNEDLFSDEICENIIIEITRSASNYSYDGDDVELPITVDCDVDECVSIFVNDVEYVC